MQNFTNNTILPHTYFYYTYTNLKHTLNKEQKNMHECKNCRKEISKGDLLGCPNCGATICGDCASTTLRICPYCYSDLEYMG